ncbi:TRAP dicarboxylate transporter, DctQ subunit, unknown substrate 3 [hydrothermal vent metagenome]|uniref:Tripartite ATP-independent periplasmic transporters DctQ component domain-containing protein n=1 Tax=hydrothermal vent metagenome TaxID=652676 RepID=A0A3B1AYD0_9ZZZZ
MKLTFDPQINARGILPELESRVGQVIARMTRLLAVGGGIILTAIALMTVASILGRALISLGLKPIPGDFELVEAGCAVAVFSFLPWCQYNRGHVTVDILSNTFPQSVQLFLMLLGNIALTIVASVIFIKMWPGLVEKFTYGETTFILGMPVWYGYALGIIGAGMFAITCIYTVWRSFNELVGGRNVAAVIAEH